MTTKVLFCPQCGQPTSKGVRDGQERVFCPDQTCGFVHWNNPTPVVAAIVEYNGEVLLARNAAWPPAWYALITGFLEAKESPQAAVLREVKEELNLDGEVIELVGVYDFEMMNQVIIVYHVKAWGDISLSEELADYRLLPPQKVRPWTSGTGEALKKWLADRNIFNEEIDFRKK
jgi:NAD+ diphosphatase